MAIVSPCCALLLFTVLALPGAAAPLTFKASPVPGGVVVVPVPGGAQAPRVTYHGERVLVRRGPAGWLAVVGIPLSAKPGQDSLETDGPAVTFTLQAKRYPEQRLRLKDPRQVNPSPEDELRIAREDALSRPAWRAWPEGLTPTLRFLQPTPGTLTSSFGLRRVFNGEPRAPHSGLDIKAPAGRAVKAPADGIVVLTGAFFFSGNCVFLAHGEGVVSLFAHLSRIKVQEGQLLKTGDPLGDVGMTGRATGPHLHWSLSLNGARVDPRLFLDPPPGFRAPR